jgi:sugar phosphate permease
MKNITMTNREKERRSVLYGWSIVGTCFFINLYTNGAVQYGFTAFLEPIVREFGWSYAQVSLAASIRGFEMGLLAPVAGLLIYRLGPRWLVFTGTCSIGLGLMLLSRIHTLPMFYGACILTSMGMGLTIGVVPMTVVAQWFRKRVSTATGIAVSGTALGGIIVPLATMLIDIYGWRTAMLVLGIGMWVLPMPLSLLLRNKPERYGCLPDGEIIDTDTSCQSVNPADQQKTKPKIPLGRILTSATFWLITLAFTANLLIIAAVLTHVMPYLGTIGMSRSVASLFASALPICTILGRLGFGWLGDRYDRRRLTACAFALNSLAILMFGNLASAGPWLILPFIILFGVGHGGIVIMTPVLVGGYFSREMFGAVLGFVMGFMTLGQILGPPFAGWVFDTWGSYQGAWYALAGLAIVGVGIVLAIPRERHFAE